MKSHPEGGEGKCFPAWYKVSSRALNSGELHGTLPGTPAVHTSAAAGGAGVTSCTPALCQDGLGTDHGKAQVGEVPRNKNRPSLKILSCFGMGHPELVPAVWHMVTLPWPRLCCPLACPLALHGSPCTPPSPPLIIPSPLHHRCSEHSKQGKVLLKYGNQKAGFGKDPKLLGGI